MARQWKVPGTDVYISETAAIEWKIPGTQSYVNETQAAAGGVTYPQLERGIRGLDRGLVIGGNY